MWLRSKRSAADKTIGLLSAGSIAPRPVQVVAPDLHWHGEPERVREAIRLAAPVWELFDASGALELQTPSGFHPFFRDGSPGVEAQQAMADSIATRL